MRRFAAITVDDGFVIACRFAGVPTNISILLLLSFDTANIDGVVLPPSEFSQIWVPVLSVKVTQLFVVPKSIPIVYSDKYLCDNPNERNPIL